MSAQTRLISLELDAFRGFAAPVSFDLDADVVLVRGDNGTGKTCIADALLWLFTGAIPRLTARGKGLRKGEDAIVSRYRPKASARVRLTVALSDGRRLEFERQGGADRSTLAAWHGEELPDAEARLAKAFGATTHDQLVQAVGSWGILQQHALLAALDSGATLHQRLAEVVGLERVTRFADSANHVAKQLTRERRQAEAVLASLRALRTDAASRLAEAQAEVTDAADARQRLASIVAVATADLPDGVSIARQPGALDEMAAVGRELGEVVEVARDVASAEGDLAAAQAVIVDFVSDVEREVGALVEFANRAAKRAPLQIQLAGAALELLGDTCPVCGQPIDTASVREHLLELVQTAEAESTAAVDAQRAIATAQARLQSARLAEERRAALEQRRDDAIERLRGVLAGSVWLAVAEAWTQKHRGAELAAELGRFQERLREAYSEARRTTPEQVARLSAELEAADTEITRSQAEVEESTRHAQRAAELDKAAHVAANRIVERALQRLAPSFAEVFDRLSPHPTFTELRATQDIFYGKNQIVPEVYDAERNVSGNPALVFSEGQLNVVALSYFLGLALNAGDASLPFVVLDDPLQSMDVLSVLGFSDLCRRLRERRQLIVTTHDRRFATLLGRKLAPREADSRTIEYELDAWTEQGPQVRTSEEPMADIIPLLSRQAS